MMAQYYSFIKIEKSEDLAFIQKSLKKIDVQKILKGLFLKRKYIYFPEINTIINQYNEKEVYFLERRKEHG